MILDLLAKRWPWFAAGAALCGVAALLAASRLIGPKFTASAQLLRYDTPGVSDNLKSDTPMSSETFAGLICAPELLRGVGETAHPPIPEETMAKLIKVDPDSESDLINVALAARTPQQAVDLLNIYLTNSVNYLRKYQAQQVLHAADLYLKSQVDLMNKDIADLKEQYRALAMPWEITNKAAQVGNQLSALSRTLNAPARVSPVVALETERLNLALADLAALSAKFTDIHPQVLQKQAEVKALKAQIAADSTNAFASALPSGVDASMAMAPALQPSAPAINPEADIIRAKLLSLEEGSVQLVKQQRAAALYVANPPGMARVFAPATLTTVRSNMRRLKIAIAGLIGALLGLGGSLTIVMLIEFADGRLKTAADVTRVTQLPVLTTLGDTQKMNADAQSQWAFRTWTMLQGRLSPTADHGLVCGFTSSAEGEGRSTWIRLLAEAASLTGFRVLTVATRPPGGKEDPGATHACDLLPDALSGKEPGESLATMKGNGNGSELPSPAQITDQLTDPNSRPVVHIPLPGWVWNRERRQQWHAALNQWRKIENLVILVELPPADVPETVLLGSSLPNLIWLSETGAKAEDTREQLETLRHARCNIVGAVLNKETARPIKKRFPRWIPCVAILSLLALHQARAQTPAAPPEGQTQTNVSFSIVHPWQRAAWQEHLTLGPGDVLNFGLFGQPELALQDIAVGPDGRVTFLEAQDVMATGLTIDELRARMDAELSKYRRAPHTLITPVAFRSKKYYVLGKVMVKGTYVLDRPLTVLEAIARAKGFENGLVDRSVVDLADFSRSFISRNGKRMPLNFERLFEYGDLSQNVPIEPGDYIYISGLNVQEVYVLGEVRLPGTVTYTPAQTIVSAITARGGFTDRAYHSRVLVVRGSLNHPEFMAINTAAILRGKTNDFRLRPKDIIYVSPRPFVRVEELADLATTAFIQGLITAWVDVKLVPPFVAQ